MSSSLLPRVGVDVWRVFSLPLPKHSILITHHHKDHLPSTQLLKKYRLVAPSNIWDILKTIYLNYSCTPVLNEPDKYGWETVETTHKYYLNGKEYEVPTYIYYKQKYLIVPEIYDVSIIDWLLEEIQPINILLTIQPPDHPLKGGIELGRYRIPLNKINFKMPTNIMLLTKEVINRNLVIRRLQLPRYVKVSVIKQNTISLDMV